MVPIEAPAEVPTGGLSKLNEILPNIITVIITFTIAFTLLMIIWAGISWIISGGDKSKVESARKKLTYAIIGLIVTLLSFFIITIFGNLFGVRLFSLPNERLSTIDCPANKGGKSQAPCHSPYGPYCKEGYTLNNGATCTIDCTHIMNKYDPLCKTSGIR